jgi:hypothetical protein
MIKWKGLPLTRTKRFDPASEGFTKNPYPRDHEWWLARAGGFGFVYIPERRIMLFELYWGTQRCIPLPDDLQHDVVVRILRANGWPSPEGAASIRHYVTDVMGRRKER